MQYKINKKRILNLARPVLTLQGINTELTGVVAGAPNTAGPRGQSKRFWPPTFSGSVKI